MDIEELKQKLKKLRIGSHNCYMTGIYIVYTSKEWLARGKELFGDEKLDWKWKCPSCGNIQSPKDFKELIDMKAIGLDERLPTPEDAYYNCIGRFTGTENEIFSKEQPCNYTLGGLMHLAHTIVLDGDKVYSMFDYPEESELFQQLSDSGYIKELNETLDIEDMRGLSDCPSCGKKGVKMKDSEPTCVFCGWAQ